MTLLTHIKSLITKLENKEVSYSFMHPEQCNVGLLVREVLGISQKELLEITNKLNINSWVEFTRKYHNPRLNLKQHEFIELLESKGLKTKDIYDLEMLENYSFLKKIGHIHCNSEGNLLLYLKEWVIILEN